MTGCTNLGILTQLSQGLRDITETPLGQPLPAGVLGSADDARNALETFLSAVNERHILARISPSWENERVARVLDQIMRDMAGAVVCGCPVIHDSTGGAS